MPGTPLPLHIFEPRYRQLTVDLVTGVVPDKQFGVIAVREGWTPDNDPGDEAGALHRVGCTAELIDARRLPDGRFDIVTRGVRRFRLLNVDAEARPYLTGEVEYVPDEPAAAPDDLAALVTAARAAHRRYCVTAWKSGDWSEPADEVVPAELAHLLAADCLLPMSDRQLLLEQTSPEIRLRMVRALLIREAGLLNRLRAVPAPMHTYAVEHSAN
jgi:Lon protease-like protein